jgi:hypothetical protein
VSENGCRLVFYEEVPGGDGAREPVLRSIEKTEFFTTVRTKTIAELCGNPQVYQMFGSGGPSVELAGYIDRGFDDFSWLPNT